MNINCISSRMRTRSSSRGDFAVMFRTSKLMLFVMDCSLSFCNRSIISEDISSLLQQLHLNSSGVKLHQSSCHVSGSYHCHNYLFKLKNPIIVAAIVPRNTKTFTIPFPVDTSFLNNLTSLLSSFMLS